MLILALDPGPTQTGWCELEMAPLTVLGGGVKPNEDILKMFRGYGYDAVIIEEIASYGMAVGREVFSTVWWSGRLFQAAHREWPRVEMMPRKTVKLHLCGSMKAKDTNIRQALIDRFGGIACTKKGGALYGVKSHGWAALALGVTYAETHEG